MKNSWVKFPNGLVWKLKDGLAQGTVDVPNYEECDQEARLDAISEAVTGSIAGLTDFTYQYRGNEVVSFCGNVCEMLDDQGDEVKVLDVASDELRTTLAEQYGLDDADAIHALQSLDLDYGDECQLDTFGSGRSLRCPASPQECAYVRIVVDGLEIAYWHQDEWKDAPAEVMGAIIGAARNGVGNAAT